MLKRKIHTQNLAYCRYLQIWSILKLFNLVQSSPLISLSVVSIIHLINIGCSSKRIGILFQDYVLIGLIYSKDRQIYIYENIFVFLAYLQFLLILRVNFCKLYIKYLPVDDKKYEMENYIQYLYRIWSMFFGFYKKIERT